MLNISLCLCVAARVLRTAINGKITLRFSGRVCIYPPCLSPPCAKYTADPYCFLHKRSNTLASRYSTLHPLYIYQVVGRFRWVLARIVLGCAVDFQVTFDITLMNQPRYIVQ